MSLGTSTAGVAAGDRFSPHPCDVVLERLRGEVSTHFDGLNVRLAPAGLRERVLSYVLRVAVLNPGDDTPRSHLFIKVFKVPQDGSIQKMRARVAHDFETTRRIHEAMSGCDDLGTVRPLACYPEHLAIVTEETLGETLGALLKRRARWFPRRHTVEGLCDAMAGVGRWVRRFQTIDQGTDRISLDELRSYINLRLERLVREPLARFTSVDQSRVLGHIDALVPLVDPSDLADVLVHADLAPGNVLIAGRRVVVLDFAMAHRGSRLLDVSRLHVQLDLMRAKPQFRGQTIRVLQKALLRGFDPNLTEDLPLFRLLLLRHQVNHLTMLSVRRERLPAAAYNAHLRRLHRRWLEQELSSAFSRRSA